jgi:hypothetical protein
MYAKNHVSKKPVVGAGAVKIHANGGIDSDDDESNNRNSRRITKM